MKRPCWLAGAFGVLQSVYNRVKGVEAYHCGATRAGRPPRLRMIRYPAENTGHAESLEIHFDPSKLSYGTILRIFFSVVHDPTQLNRQGPDVGNLLQVCHLLHE